MVCFNTVHWFQNRGVKVKRNFTRQEYKFKLHNNVLKPHLLEMLRKDNFLLLLSMIFDVIIDSSFQQTARILVKKILTLFAKALNFADTIGCK